MKLKSTLRIGSAFAALTGAAFWSYMGYKNLEAWGPLSRAAADGGTAAANHLYGEDSETNRALVRHYGQAATRHLEEMDARLPSPAYGQLGLLCFSLAGGLLVIDRRFLTPVNATEGEPESTAPQVVEAEPNLEEVDALMTSSHDPFRYSHLEPGHYEDLIATHGLLDKASAASLE